MKTAAENTFVCSRDQFVKSRTRLFVAIFLLCAVVLLGDGIWLYNLSDSLAAAGLLILLLFLISVGLVLPAAFHAPINYQVTKTEVLIRMRARSVAIPIKDIRGIETRCYEYIFQGAYGGGTAVGMFGIVGHFYADNLKEFDAYLTRKDNLVVLGVGSEFKVLSPDQPDDFVRCLKELTGQHSAL